MGVTKDARIEDQLRLPDSADTVAYELAADYKSERTNQRLDVRHQCSAKSNVTYESVALDNGASLRWFLQPNKFPICHASFDERPNNTGRRR
jgi:hypothetical protein